MGPTYTERVQQYQQARADYEFRQQEAERRQRAVYDAQMDRQCLTPPDRAWVNWCAAREREKDRAAQQLRWEQEQANAAAMLNMQQQLLEQQKQAEKERQIDESVDRMYRR